MQKLVNNLENLGLSKAEAIVYIDILQNPNSNGSQITHRINLPKPSVYLALDKLYQKGIISLIPGKSKQYAAQDADIALEELRKKFNTELDNSLKEIRKLKQAEKQADFIHINGYVNFTAQLNAIIKNCQSELYLHSNVDLNEFTEELSTATTRGVRIINYSFGNQYTYDFINEGYFDSGKPASDDYRLLAVSDYKECLMAHGKPDAEYLTIYTKNQLQVSLIAENIHNAIYWLKLYQENPQFTYPCRIGTLAEKDVHPSGYII